MMSLLADIKTKVFEVSQFNPTHIKYQSIPPKLVNIKMHRPQRIYRLHSPDSIQIFLGILGTMHPICGNLEFLMLVFSRDEFREAMSEYGMNMTEEEFELVNKVIDMIILSLSIYSLFQPPLSLIIADISAQRRGG